MSKTIRPYGTWASPVSAELLAGQSLRLGQVQALGGDLYWSEGRPADAGRITIVHRAADGTELEPLQLPELDLKGIEAVAIALLHSHSNPSHERALGA